MTESGLPAEVKLAEECSAALDRGDVEAARRLAWEGLRLAAASPSSKWAVRFQHLLTMCEPHTPEPTTPELVRCSFCGQQSSGRRRVVAGPRVFICKSCVKECASATVTSPGIRRVKRAEARCSFCDQAGEATRPLYEQASVRICADCIEVCMDIFRHDFKVR